MNINAPSATAAITTRSTQIIKPLLLSRLILLDVDGGDNDLMVQSPTALGLVPISAPRGL
jgi:hypothetical protein